jgi:hypothetical protein
MFGAIVLRDVPKQRARIDLWTYEIKGGFRGYQNVMPGVHYVSVLADGEHVGFWCSLQPQSAVVRVFSEGGFREDTPESEAQFSRMALGGAMNHALLPYKIDQFPEWLSLTRHIGINDPLPALHADDQGTGTRFDKAFLATHGGNVTALLAEFQFAFLRWFVDPGDEAALARWRHLLLAAYDAGEDRIRSQPDLFESLVTAIMAQFKYLPDTFFAEGSFVTMTAGHLVEDMIDTDIPNLVEKARAFQARLKSR